MSGNIIVAFGSVGRSSPQGQKILMTLHEKEVRCHCTTTISTSGSAYWRMAKKAGLFGEINNPAHHVTIMYVVNERDDIVDAAINPDDETISRFIELSQQDKPRVQKKELPQMPMSPLMEDGLNGPFLRNPDGSRVS